jgi:hypothetical protein
MAKPLTDWEIEDLKRTRQDQPNFGVGFMVDRLLATIDRLRADAVAGSATPTEENDDGS